MSLSRSGPTATRWWYANKGGNLNGYIFMIAKNEVVNYYRSRQQIIAYQKDFVEDVRIEARIDESIDSKRLAAVIERIVAALPRTRREVFIMSRYRHMSNAEIALHLGDFETHGRETHQPRTGKTAHGARHVPAPDRPETHSRHFETEPEASTHTTL